MIQRRLVALALIFLVGVAACVPAHAEEDTRAIRGGKHLSRFVEQALIVRCDRGGQRIGQASGAAVPRPGLREPRTGWALIES